jgi:hypothetical protein
MKLSLRAGKCVFALLLVATGSNVFAQPDQYTPLIVSPLTPATQTFLGTDGKMHIVYELILTNASPTAANVQEVEAVDAAKPSRVVGSWTGQSLVASLRTTASTAAASAEIPFNETRLLLLEIELQNGAAVPTQLVQRITLLGANTPARSPGTPIGQTYTVAPIDIGSKVPVIGPPLAGTDWVAMNGCCEVTGAHRATGLAVNGQIYFAQRFAIDWMKLDSAGRLLHGDPADVHSFTGYGAEILAVADGTVVSTLNSLDDQKPGSLPDPKTINIDNVDGNHVVLDLGSGIYAFYAHMQKGSVAVAIGEHVKRGQALGKLGNTGNTSAPHLHFHLMNGPSVLGSSGIPYVIDSFGYDGQIPAEKFAKAPSLEGSWTQDKLPKPVERHNEFPMDLAIVSFSGQ